MPRPRGATSADWPIAAVLGVGEPGDDERVAEFAAEAARRAGSALSVLQIRRPRPEPDDWTQHEAEGAERFPGLEVRHTELPGAKANQVLAATSPLR